MRIDRLEVTNFKKFAQASFEFPRSIDAPPDSGSVHVLIGENGSGKTSVLDALAVALGVWLVKTPDSSLAGSRRPIYWAERRREWRDSTDAGDRPQFVESTGGTSIRAEGAIAGRAGLAWELRIDEGKVRGSNTRAKEALSVIEQAYERARMGEPTMLPVIAYYGPGRAWMSHHDRGTSPKNGNGVGNRWGAFYDCLNERIRVADLVAWIRGEAIARGNNQGRWRAGFEVVRWAVLRTLPGADDLWFQSEPEEIVVSVGGVAQPLSNLSAGQRTVFALVLDLAIRMVTQNNHLVPSSGLKEGEELPHVLAESPGVVLIDEIDVHLHPKWQRGVVDALRETFPRIQFIATTHSPFIVQSLREGELIMLDGGQPVPEFGKWSVEAIARGLMGVGRTDVGARYASMMDVATDYLSMVAKVAAAPESTRLDWEQSLKERISPFADNPAFQAYLELEKVAAFATARNGDHAVTRTAAGGE